MLGFLNITIIDVIDIILVAFLIYQCFRLLKGTSVIGIAIGIVTLYVFWFVVSALNMDLLSSIMEQVLGVGVIALIILFQQEIRKFLFQIGKRSINSRLGKLSRRFLNSNKEVDAGSIEEITQACRRMSETRTGALMVFRRISSMENIIETGDKVDSIINRRLIENIFWKNTPLHDGAMIVDNNRIVAARCTLPISQNLELPPQYGLRHRAAASVTSETDAFAIVVSEETGNISFVVDGTIRTVTSLSELKLSIESAYNEA